jgi:hypothetical protein
MTTTHPPADKPHFDDLLEAEWLTTTGPLKLLRPLVYHSASGRVFTVPKDFTTDLATIPTWLPGAIRLELGTELFSGEPGVLHDMAYALGPSLTPPVNREQADALLYEALLAVGASKARAEWFYLGVRVAGQFAWDEHRKEDGKALRMPLGRHHPVRLLVKQACHLIG